MREKQEENHQGVGTGDPCECNLCNVCSCHVETQRERVGNELGTKSSPASDRNSRSDANVLRGCPCPQREPCASRVRVLDPTAPGLRREHSDFLMKQMEDLVAKNRSCQTSIDLLFLVHDFQHTLCFFLQFFQDVRDVWWKATSPL